ncbi:putative ABC transport system permease protein [Brevibacterium sp. Mu109]|uniref:ABC transporter permease n=1 Tax=Brevibacterium sp. Mu109 TaxID=1255669 RepID=UPI000C6562EC|nr:ABC transporter permease [Brevibacterium sp. Mu109]SMX64829.1 putative ABC transport system permease protein [Brevibacterium sp. Mu109]
MGTVRNRPPLITSEAVLFLAWRDMRFARGRFALITGVVLLMTLLIGLLSGLTGGLAQQNISAVRALDGERVVLAAETFDESELTDAQVEAWNDSDLVENVREVGILRFTIDAPEADSGSTEAAGADETGTSAPGISAAMFGGAADSPARDGQVALSPQAAEDLGVGDADQVSVLGIDLAVDVLAEDRWYAHTPVAYVTMSDWQEMQTRLGRDDVAATALTLDVSDNASEAGDASVDDQLEALAEESSTTVNSNLSSLLAIASFRSEIGSLLMMVGMLFGISALVVGAFFTVWTMQRTGDVAVLKALGASTPSLMRDALGQSLAVLIAGVGGGILLTAALGLAVSGVVPFVVAWYTTLLPAVLLIALGLVGAAFALRSVTQADPLTALGSAR